MHELKEALSLYLIIEANSTMLGHLIIHNIKLIVFHHGHSNVNSLKQWLSKALSINLYNHAALSTNYTENRFEIN